MNHQPSVKDLRFLVEFESGKLNPSQFRHKDHLRVAYALLATGTIEQCRTRTKTALLGFLTKHGVDLSKYSETLTSAWILAVCHFMHVCAESRGFDDFISQQPLLLDKSIMTTHYSERRLYSDHARRGFIDPDLEPIPLYQERIV